MLEFIVSFLSSIQPKSLEPYNSNLIIVHLVILTTVYSGISQYAYIKD